MLEADELETRGDAARALRVIEDMPVDTMGRPFWRPERERRLRQLVVPGDAAPAWVRGRWILAQAAQSTPGDVKRALALAVRTRGGPSTLWGVDELDAQCKVIDHDWVYRQLVLHEYGGLATFLRMRANSALLSAGRGFEAWVGAPMGAFELFDEAPAKLTWRHVGSDRLVDTVNLGGAALCARGAHVIGRVVEADAVAVFESPPLCVPADVAEAVAASPADWISALAAGYQGPHGPVLAEFVARVHHFDLLCDMPCNLRRQMIQPDDPALRADQLGSGATACSTTSRWCWQRLQASCARGSPPDCQTLPDPAIRSAEDLAHMVRHIFRASPCATSGSRSRPSRLPRAGAPGCRRC